METSEVRDLAEKVLSAWNDQDVEAVLACYTGDCLYRDPNTRGTIAGRADLRRYLTRLFADWKMHWSLREFFTLGDSGSGAFLWRATLTPAAGGRIAEIEGMDLVLLRDGKLERNEVYFDRMALMTADAA